MAQLEIHTVNVGQGDAAFLVFKDDSGKIDQLILVDTGPQKSNTVVKYWSDNFFTIGKMVDMVIISHWDEDHYGGLNDCKEGGMFNPNCPLYSPQKGRKKYEVFQYFNTNDWKLPHKLYELGGIDLICYASETQYEPFPPDNTLRGQLTSPKNDSSLVFLVTFQRNGRYIFRYYTGGDLAQAYEEKMVQKLPILEDTHSYLSSMKVSHHGSKTSTPEIFLQKTRPMMAIISVGTENRYDHPSQYVINQLTNYNVLTFKTNDVGITTKMCTAISGNSIKQIITEDDEIIQAALDEKQGKIIGMEGAVEPSKSYCFWTWRTVAILSIRVVSTSNYLFPDTPLGKLLQPYFSSIPLTIAPDGISCSIPRLPLHPALPYELNDCVLQMKPDNQTAHCTAIWKDIPVTGVMDNTGHLLLKSTEGKVQIALPDLIRFAFGEQFDLFAALPDTLLPKVGISGVTLDVDLGMPRAFGMSFTTKMGSDIAISKEILLAAPNITLSSGFKEICEDRGIHSLNVCLSTALTVGARSLLLSMDFSTSPVWMLNINSENITLQDLILLVPSANNGGAIEQWCNWMGLKNIGIRQASIGVSVHKGIHLYSLEFQFAIKLFSRFSTLLGWTHRVSGEDTVFGEIEDQVNIYDLLEAAGVSRSHLSFLPDVTIDSCVFSATPSSKCFNVSAGVSFEQEQKMKMGELLVAVNSIEITIEKKEAATHIALAMEGTLNGASIKFSASYSATEGFAFSGELQQIEVARLLETVIPVKGTLVSRFDVQLKEVAFSMKKEEILFAAGMPLIKFSEQVCLENNKMMLHIERLNNQTAFSMSVSTQLKVVTGGQTIVAEGTVAVSPQSIYFFASLKTPFCNVLGIKRLNIGNLTISLSENLKPAGMGIGLMGELAFGKLNGDIALYFSPQNPGKELVAINFSGLSLLDIVSVFVQCPDGGVGKVLESIALQPIRIAENQDIPESDNSITTLIDTYERDKGTYEIQTTEKYSWIPNNKRVIKNRSNFKTYELVSLGNGTCYLQKYVGMYACINPKGEGIVLNEVTFRPGFAFCARLLFLGMKANVDFTAEPRRGIRLMAEMETALKIGKWLQMCRVEDANKGPVLSLCTYPESFAFYFSAKIKILSLFEAQARVAFADNKFAFMLYYNLLGFRTTIEASGNPEGLRGSGFTLYMAYETNGFSEVTGDISKFLHQKADEVNNATKSAVQKLENARRTIAEHQRSMVNTQNQINGKENYLNQLRHTRYPWYKAYMYIALGVRIAAVAAEIGALAAYKLVVIGLIKTAEGILMLAEKAVQAAGTAAAGAMKIIGDVTAIIGKSIDWLIRLDEIKARLELDAGHLLFQFDIRYQLCGNKHAKAFELKSDGSLKDTLVQVIKGVFNNVQIANNGNDASQLDALYGFITAEERKQMAITEWDIVEEKFEMIAAHGNIYMDLLQGIQKDIEGVDEALNPSSNNLDAAPLTVFSQSLTYDDIKRLTEDLNRTALACSTLEQLDETACEKDFDTLQAALIELQAGKDTNVYRNYQSTRERSLKWLDKRQGQQQVISSLLEKAGKSFTGVCNNRVEDTALPDGYAHEIISRYRRIIDNPSTSSYTKTLFCEALSFAWKEEGNISQSKKFADKAIEMTIDIWGANSEELRVLKEKLDE